MFKKFNCTESIRTISQFQISLNYLEKELKLLCPIFLPSSTLIFGPFYLSWGIPQHSNLSLSAKGVEAEKVKRWSSLGAVSCLMLPSESVRVRAHSALRCIREEAWRSWAAWPVCLTPEHLRFRDNRSGITGESLVWEPRAVQYYS